MGCLPSNSFPPWNAAQQLHFSLCLNASRVLPAASFSCAWMGHGCRIDSAVAEYGTDQSATSSGKPDCNIEERIVDFNVPVHLSWMELCGNWFCNEGSGIQPRSWTAPTISPAASLFTIIFGRDGPFGPTKCLRSRLQVSVVLLLCGHAAPHPLNSSLIVILVYVLNFPSRDLWCMRLSALMRSNGFVIGARPSSFLSFFLLNECWRI